MRTTRLTFDQLGHEFAVITRENLTAIKGGVTPAGSSQFTAWLSQELGVPVMCNTDVNGNWTVSTDGGITWMNLVFQLDEVEIQGQRNYSRPSIFTSGYSGFGITWTDGNGNIYGNSDGGYGGGPSDGGGNTPENKILIANGQSGATALDIINIMMSY